MRTYVATFAVLLLLTGLTLGLSFVPLGAWGPVVTVLIALTKSVLVALFFMHLVEHRVSARMTIGVGLALAAFLVGFAFLDVRTRAAGGAGGDRPGAVSPAGAAPP